MALHRRAVDEQLPRLKLLCQFCVEGKNRGDGQVINDTCEVALKRYFEQSTAIIAMVLKCDS